MTEEEKEKFIKRLNDINKYCVSGSAEIDCYETRQTRAEAGLYQLITVIQDIINAL